VRVGALLALLVACGGRVPRGEPAESETPFCVRASYLDQRERLRIATHCFQTIQVCHEAAGLIVKWGRFVHVQEVGSCEEAWP